MRVQEAIKNIDDILDSPYLCDESIDYQLTTDDIECLEMAKKALEKQIPEKPIKSERVIRYCEVFKCPTCGLEFSGRVSNYCYHCGQALDWSDTE